MGECLGSHRAGELIAVEPNRLFRRETDRFVHRELNKTSMEVGASWIARTAHAALRLISELGDLLGSRLPLAWERDWRGATVIEVYPAATLLSRSMMAKGYKKKADIAKREVLLQQLASHIGLPKRNAAMLENADALDAAVCVLAGADFIRGTAYEPNDFKLARREGWIWFKKNGS